MSKWMIIAVILAACVCRAGEVQLKNSAFDVWVADSLVKILPDTPMPANASGKISVEAVRNEYESAQFVVTAREKVEVTVITAGKMVGPSKIVPRVEVNFLGFVPVKRGTTDTPPEHLAIKAPADIPDPLLETRTATVEAGKSQPIWLTVYVPKKAQPGEYKGTIDISTSNGPAAVSLAVKVHPVTLPDARTLYLTNWFSTWKIANAHGLEQWGEAHWKMIEAYARMMADHRQNVVLTQITELIKGQEDSKGNLTFDFSMFDRWVELFTRAGVIGTIEGGHFGTRGPWEAPDFDALLPEIKGPDGVVKPKPAFKVTSEEMRKYLSQFLPALQKHLEEKGWVDNYIQHLADEPIPQNAESYKKLASYVREYAPKIRIIDASMCTEIAGSIDIWVPQPPEYEQKEQFFNERRKAGDEVWFYTCLSPKGKYMNRFIDYPLLDTRLLHWVNFKYDMPGYLHWGFNHWQGDPFTFLEPNWGGDNFLPPGDSHIVYPGKRGPLSSIRLEALRDGIEDYELLILLKAKNLKKAREICDSVVRSLTDYTLDPSELRKARLKLIKALED